jgi:hypothetical protein
MSKIIKQIEFIKDKEIDSLINLTLDGNYIGNIDNFIKEKFYKEGNLYRIIIGFPQENNLYMSEKFVYNVTKYTNEFPIIIDKVKNFFNLISVRYNIVTINKENYLIYKNYNEVTLKDYLEIIDNSEQDSYKNQKIKDDVKKVIGFSWLMCIKNGAYSGVGGFENNILIKPYNSIVTNIKEYNSPVFLYSINDKKYGLKLSDTSLNIPENALNKWFDGSLEEFYKVVKSMIQGIEADFMRSKILDIVNEYNNDYVVWVNAVYERFRFIKNLKF